MDVVCLATLRKTRKNTNQQNRNNNNNNIYTFNGLFVENEK